MNKISNPLAQNIATLIMKETGISYDQARDLAGDILSIITLAAAEAETARRPPETSGQS